MYVYIYIYIYIYIYKMWSLESLAMLKYESRTILHAVK